MIRRRGLWTQLCFMLVALAIAACNAPRGAAPAAEAPSAPADPAWQKVIDAAKQEGSVLVYGTGFLKGVEGTQVTAEFQRIYGISVDNIEGAGSPSFQRIREETKAGVPSADIFLGSPPWPATVEQEGYFMTIKDKPLPIFTEPKTTWKVDPASMSDSYVPQTLNYPNGHIVINTKLLAPADYPTSFHQLATDPKYRGKIAWVDPKTTGDIAFKWTVWGYIGNSMTLDDVWQIYTNQKPTLYDAPPSLADAVSRGDAPIGIALSGFEGSAAAGAPIKVLRFADTPVVNNITAMGILKAARHPNAAMVFINWALSKEGMDYITKTAHYQSLRFDVPDGLPDALTNVELVGGTKKGPSYVIAPIHAVFAADLHNKNDIWRQLPTGVDETEFVNTINGYIADWEAANGGPQHDGIPLAEK